MALRGMPSYSVDSGFWTIDHAALALDRPHAQRAVAAGAREHDADGPLALVLGQGAEEEVDRQAQAARRGRFQQVQRAIQKGHVVVGRDDVGAVGLHRHPVLDLEDLHAGVAPDQVGQDALVVRGQVLHQDKGHAGIGVGGHAGEEGLERRQPPGRRADADDGKVRDVRTSLRIQHPPHLLNQILYRKWLLNKGPPFIQKSPLGDHIGRVAGHEQNLDPPGEALRPGFQFRSGI